MEVIDNKDKKIHSRIFKQLAQPISFDANLVTYLPSINPTNIGALLRRGNPLLHVEGIIPGAVVLGMEVMHERNAHNFPLDLAE